MKHYVLCLIFVQAISQGSVMAQDIHSDSTFKQIQTASLNNWLNKTEFGNVIHFEKSKMLNDSVHQFLFSIPGIKAWNSFNDSLKANKLPSAGQLIGNKVTFLFDDTPENTELIFEATDGDIIVTFNEGLFESEIEYSQGDSDPNKAKIAFTGKLFPKNASFFEVDIEKDHTLRQYKDILLKILDNMCRGHSTLLNSYKINTDFDIDHDFRITITNIKELVLDESYFEKITLWFLIDPISRSVMCQYGCKYSAGNLWAPRDSRYRDASEKFPDAVDNFGNKLKSNVYNGLTK